MTALLFDFDGTIADTAALWPPAIRACFAAYGTALDDELLSRVLDNPWADVLPRLSPSAAAAIERDIVASVRDAYLACPPTEGLIALLETFASVPKAVVTSSYREELIAPYLRRHGLDKHFSAVVGCEDTERLKPDPEPVLLALRLLNAGRRGTWLIGDSLADIQAAKSAGIGSIALGNLAAGGDRFAESVQALRALLTAIVAEDEYHPE
jgi:HAD superfamily hydrolase (TIGR01549 family)